ncbi:MAG: tetratricopeptide repeat protein [Anaerolineales bacterium]|nr:tetratricopeptide repeat protein [Anaerolineales bacterium]
MNRRRRRINWFRISIFLLLIAMVVYVNLVVLPGIEPIGVPTPTATRSPESFVTEAETLFEQGKLFQSIEAYQDAIKSNPSDPTTHIALARVQVYAQQHEDAQTSAENALLLNPNNSMAHAVRAWALDFQGDYLAAESAIKRSLEIDPNNGMAHALYAEILIDAYLTGSGVFENVEKAIEESRVAMDLSPNTLETHRARGYVLEATQNYEEAIREYESAISINANIPDLHLSLGLNYRALGVYDKAIEEFTRANALNPGDPNPDLYISRTYATIGEYAKAAQYAETALKDNPADASLHGNLGVMYYRNFQWPEARDELSLVANGGETEDGVVVEPLPISNNTRITEYYFTYALVLARLNDCGEALKIAQQIQAAVPADEIAVINANEAINICQQNLDPSPTATPEETEEPTEAPLTPTPES